MHTGKSILISPYSKVPGSAKEYPHWQELVNILSKKYTLIQVGVGKEPKLSGCKHCFDMNLVGLETLTKEVGFFYAVDNFFHHMAHYLHIPGVVLFGPSDPEIFGYKDQVNIIKSRDYLRKDQFGFYFADYVWPHTAIGWYAPDVIATMGEVQ